MTAINYNKRVFKFVSNSASGEVSSETTFYYNQKDDVVWATYEGGAVKFGTLTAKVLENGALDMRYSHVNKQGNVMTGVCHSTPEILGDGRIRLYEKWQWSCGDFSAGESIIEETKLELAA